MNAVIVCSPSLFLIRCITYCPTCKTRRRFIGADALWYGATWTCCRCGDSWNDGERMVRPFARGWRAEATTRARARWEEAGPYDKAAHTAWLKAQMGED